MAGKAAKIAISLPADVLEEVERTRRSRRQSRSEFFRQAVEALLRRERERKALCRYVRGYQRLPEGEEEVAAAHEAGSTVLAQEPWE